MLERVPQPAVPARFASSAWIRVSIWNAGSTKSWSITSSMASACRSLRYTAPVLIIARSRRRSRPLFPSRDTGGSIRTCRGWASTTDGLTCNDDVVTLLCDFIDHLGAGPVMLLGHSYGAYLARGVAARRPDTVLGLALLCPVAERSRSVPRHDVVRRDSDAYDELEPAHRAGFEDYFVLHTQTTARRYRDRVAPGTALVDEAALGRIFAGWTVDVGSTAFSAPTLVVAGRRDSVAGYADAAELLGRYPHATLAVIEDAGHALMHERPELLAALLGDWLDRARPEDE